MCGSAILAIWQPVTVQIFNFAHKVQGTLNTGSIVDAYLQQAAARLPYVTFSTMIMLHSECQHLKVSWNAGPKWGQWWWQGTSIRPLSQRHTLQVSCRFVIRLLAKCMTTFEYTFSISVKYSHVRYIYIYIYVYIYIYIYINPFVHIYMNKSHEPCALHSNNCISDTNRQVASRWAVLTCQRKPYIQPSSNAEVITQEAKWMFEVLKF